mmetsp:Transcript_140186/g.349401  ORF Transcript_140186/g.349401 Transcript_140186/m.349401 type:complete len:80 (+) Transcript_140186:754-993(+)
MPIPFLEAKSLSCIVPRRHFAVAIIIQVGGWRRPPGKAAASSAQATARGWGLPVVPRVRAQLGSVQQLMLGLLMWTLAV